jgi:hypothetical protein
MPLLTQMQYNTNCDISVTCMYQYKHVHRQRPIEIEDAQRHVDRSKIKGIKFSVVPLHWFLLHKDESIQREKGPCHKNSTV